MNTNTEYIGDHAGISKENEEVRNEHGRKEQFVYDNDTKSYAWRVLESKDSKDTLIHYVDQVPTPFDRREKQIETEQDKMTNTRGPKGEHIKCVSVGGKYSVWGLTRSGQIHRLNLRESPVWEKLQTGLVGFTDICSGRRDSLFAVGGFDQYIYRLERGTGKMTLVDIEDNFNLVQISALSYNKVYGIADNGVILFLRIHRFRSKKNMWTLIEGPLLKKISAGGRKRIRSEVWGIGKDNYTYRYIEKKETWFKINEELIDITVAKDCSVFGIRKDNAIVKWDGDNFIPIITADTPKNISAYKASHPLYYVIESTGDVGRLKV